MKKKILLLLMIALVVIAALFVCRYLSLPSYEVPFTAEEVSSVTLSTFWEYKIVEDQETIEELIREINKISIASNYDETKAPITAGINGYSLYFELDDGRQLEYSAVPTAGLGFRFVDEKGTAYSARNFTIGKIWNSLDAQRYPATSVDVYSIFYQGEVHKGVATVMEVPEDALLVGTVAGITYTPNYELELACSYGKTGQNVYVWEEGRVTKLGVEIEQDVWPEPQAFAITIPNSDNFSENTAPLNWGITLKVQNVTPTGLTIVCHQTGGENVSELHTGSYYVIQKLENDSWADVAYLPQEYDVGWTAEAWNIQKEGTTTWDVDWKWLYGELPVGEYRIGKEITNFRGTGDYDSEMMYAEFIVNETTDKARFFDYKESLEVLLIDQHYVKESGEWETTKTPVILTEEETEELLDLLEPYADTLTSDVLKTDYLRYYSIKIDDRLTLTIDPEIGNYGENGDSYMLVLEQGACIKGTYIDAALVSFLAEKTQQ